MTDRPNPCLPVKDVPTRAKPNDIPFARRSVMTNQAVVNRSVTTVLAVSAPVQAVTTHHTAIEPIRHRLPVPRLAATTDLPVPRPYQALPSTTCHVMLDQAVRTFRPLPALPVRTRLARLVHPGSLRHDSSHQRNPHRQRQAKPYRPGDDVPIPAEPNGRTVPNRSSRDMPSLPG
jgi:hypothetical protein